MSGRPGLSQKRFSRDRFHPLPNDPIDDNMVNPNDATIEIPLTNVPSRSGTGARKLNSHASAPDYQHPMENDHDNGEKAGLFGSRPGPGRRKRTGPGDHLHDDEEERTLNRMGRIYTAIMNFSVLTRYLIYVSPLASLIAVPIIIGATTVGQDAEIGGVRIVWFFTWIEVVWLSLWVSKLLAHFLPYTFQFLVGIVSSGTRKYALILRALEIPLSIVGWSLVSLATFIPIMTQNPDTIRARDTGIKPWESTVKQILFALLICSLILLGEKTLVQLISMSYHRKQYDLRIKESKHNVYLLGQLYEASRSMFPEYCKEFWEEDTIISDSILGAAAKNVRSRHRSGVPLRLIQNVGHNAVRIGDKITAAFGNVAHEITGKDVFNPSSAHSVVVHALEKKRSSEALARRIWMSFVVEGKDALYEDDILEVLGAQRETEAVECFQILDRDGNGDISMEEMILTVAEISRVRKSIARSMHDVDHAIHVLDNLLLTVAFIIMILVFVSFVTTGAATVIAAGATSLLSLSFVFSVTAQEVLGSCVFLFVKHPFDVGDRVEVAGNELFVEEISLLYTVFRSVGDQRITQSPNVVLNTTWIDNITRSKAMRERITLTVDFGTSFADIQLLKAEMERFVRDKENSRDFQPDVDIEVIGVGNMDKLELRIEIRHKSNWSNESIRASRRSKFMCALVLAVRKVPIYGPGGGGAALGDPTNPSYSVAISDDLAQEYRKKAAADKEAQRLVPASQLEVTSSAPPAEGQGQSSSVDMGATSVQLRGASMKEMAEAGFVEFLHSRPAGYDVARPEETEQLYRAPSSASGHANVLGVPGMNDNDKTSLLRAPSTGRRKEGVVADPPSSPTTVRGAVSAPAQIQRAPSSARPSGERYEIPSYYTPAGGEAVSSVGPGAGAGVANNGASTPYELNSPYARRSPTTISSAPTYQQPPPPRRPTAQGNAFAPQQNQQQYQMNRQSPTPEE